MPTWLQYAGLTAGVLAIAAAGAYAYYGHAPGPELPRLSATIERHTIRIGDRDRTYLSYTPANLAPGAPLVFVLHGLLMNAQWMREFTGYEFERFADEHRIMVVYPDGWRRDWNDCQKHASYPWRLRDVDDVGFILRLIERFRLERGIDPSRVYVAGYSNGGHMAFRLAIEAPDRIAAIASIAASLPAFDGWECKETGKPVPVMIVNGTSDRLNPNAGGPIRLFGLTIHGIGVVQSSAASARYFARLAGADGEPDSSLLPHRDIADRTSVERSTWRVSGAPMVVLYAIHGGGHVVPQPRYRPPRILGRVTKDLDAPREIWRFFEGHRRPETSSDRSGPIH